MIWISCTEGDSIRGFINAPNYTEAQNIADAVGDEVVVGLTNKDIEILFFTLPKSIQKKIAKLVML